MMTILRGFLSVLVVTTTTVAYNSQHKAEVLGPTSVDAASDKNDTFAGGVSNANRTIGGHFVDKWGVGGNVNASIVTASNNTQVVDTYDSSGKRQFAEVNTKEKKAHVVGTGGDSVDADLTDGTHLEAVVKLPGKNGKSKTYTIDRLGEDKVVVHRPDGGKDFVVTGLDSKQKVDILGGNYPAIAKWVGKNYKNDTPQSIGARYGENIVTNAKIGTVKDVKIVTDDRTAGGKLVLSESYGKIDGDPLNERNREGGVLKAENVRFSSCLTAGHKDVFEGDGEVHIVNKSLTVDYPPSEHRNGHPVYAFPSCFLVRLTLQVPRNFDLNTLAVQAAVYIYPLGNMQCDSAGECKDGETLNRPEGSCFYCNLCEQRRFKSADEPPVKLLTVNGKVTKDPEEACRTKKQEQIPLEFKVCPPENNTEEEWKKLFKSQLFKEAGKGDVEIDAKIFQKVSNSTTSGASDKLRLLCGNPAFKNSDICSPKKKVQEWDLQGCRRVRMSYSFSGDLLKDLNEKFSALLGKSGKK